jgi:hypothetical protein
MFVDQAGALWLSDPAMVGIILVSAVALVYWCHRWLENGSAPMPRVAILRSQSRVMRTRALRTRNAPIASAVVPLARFTKDPHATERARMANHGRTHTAA